MVRTRGWKLVAVFLLSALVVAGCLGGSRKPGQSAPGASSTGEGAPAPTVSPQPSEPGQVTVYFSDQNAERLVPVKRPVSDPNTPMQAAIHALLAGPKPGENLVGTMPRGTRLLGLSITDTTAHVDLSGEFQSNHPGGSTGEIMTLYALSNTLTEFPQIKRVVISLDGKPLDVFVHMDISGGVARREDLIGH